MKNLFLAFLAGMLLAGCAGAGTSAPAPTFTALPPTNTPLPPTATAQPTATPLPTDTPQPTSTPLLPTATSTPAPLFTHIFAFGDSYSDNGNGFYPILKEMVAAGERSSDFQKQFESYYWEGRMSNGPTAVEVLADQLNVGLTDYAVCGARSGHGNNLAGENEPLSQTGLLEQIDEYKADLNGEKADPDALYFIYISTNDFFHGPNKEIKSATDLADQAVNNMITAVTRIAELGARQFLVVNSTDLSILPITIDLALVDQATEFQSRINSILPGEMEKLAQELSIKIDIFDYSAVSGRIWDNPDEYGLTNLTDDCLVSTENRTEVCELPDDYYFWDFIHPTRVVHEIFGEAMAEQLSK